MPYHPVGSLAPPTKTPHQGEDTRQQRPPLSTGCRNYDDFLLSRTKVPASSLLLSEARTVSVGDMPLSRTGFDGDIDLEESSADLAGVCPA